MANHAQGTFAIKLQPLTQASQDGLTRMSFYKELHGDLEAVSKGEMISAGDPKKGEAGYVAMETVTGKLEGKSGSFALQQFATMSADSQNLQIKVVPGSGTDELIGIEGVFTITVASGKHSYTFQYTLPAAR